MNLEALLQKHHGVLTTADLKSAGFNSYRVRQAVEKGVLVRAHRGKYFAPGQKDAISVARALGGTLTCVSAMAHYGLWVPETPRRPHIRLTRAAAGSVRQTQWMSELAPRAHLHVASATELEQPLPYQTLLGVDSFPDAILTAAKCCNHDELVAIGDSALRAGVRRANLEAVAALGTVKLRKAFGLLSTTSDSGVESLVRVRIQRLQIKVRMQVRILNWLVDFLIGEWLVIEVDGRSYHSAPEEFARDRRKDRQLHELGYLVLRFTAHSVFTDWATCEQQIIRFIRANRHTRPSHRNRHR